MTPAHFRRLGPARNRRSDNHRWTQMQMPILTWKLTNLLPEELCSASPIGYLCCSCGFQRSDPRVINRHDMRWFFVAAVARQHYQISGYSPTHVSFSYPLINFHKNAVLRNKHHHRCRHHRHGLGPPAVPGHRPDPRQVRGRR